MKRRQKADFLGPISCKRTLKKEKERKKKEREGRKEEKIKKAIVALLVFVMAPLKIVFAREKTV